LKKRRKIQQVCSRENHVFVVASPRPIALFIGRWRQDHRDIADHIGFFCDLELLPRQRSRQMLQSGFTRWSLENLTSFATQSPHRLCRVWPEYLQADKEINF
jgi:hypothetical protein